MKKVFTSGDVARICRVTINTVVKWFDSGEINGYRIPSSGARRVPRKDLLEFMKKYNFPMDEIASDKLRVLVIDNDRATLSLFRKVFSDKNHYQLESTKSGFEAGLITKEFMPEIIFINVDMDDIDGNMICKALRDNQETDNVVTIALSSKTRRKTTKELQKKGYTDVVWKPFTPEDLWEIVGKYSS